MRTLRLHIIILCLLQTFLSFSQIKIYDSSKNRTFKNDHRVNIKVINNQIIVPLKFENNLTLNFILDSGVSLPILIDPTAAELLNLEYTRDIKVRGYGREKPLEAILAQNFNFRVNEEFFFKDLNVVILKEPLNMSDYLGEPIFGLIGYDFFKNNKIEINYGRETLRILRSKKPLKRRKYATYDILVRSRKPYLPITIRNNEIVDTLNLLVDTGFSGAISLYPKEAASKYITEPYIQDYRGRGINGSISSTLKKLESIDIGKNSLNDVTVNFLDSSSMVNFSPNIFHDGGLGGEILKRHRVVFDYPNRKLYLKKTRKYKEPFNYNIAGLRLKTPDWDFSKLVVEDIRPNSPTSSIGIQKNDTILRVNDKRVKYMKLEKIYGLLNDLTSPKKTVTIQRDEEILTFEFFLQDIF